MDRLPNHNAGKRFNTTAFWQSPENKSLGKKGNKKLSDLVTEGGEEAQSALTSLFVEVLSKCCASCSNSSIDLEPILRLSLLFLSSFIFFPCPFPCSFLSFPIARTFTASFHWLQSQSSTLIIKSNLMSSHFMKVNTKKLCGHRNSSIIPKNLISNNATTMALFKTKTQTDFLSEGIALVCVNYRTPMCVPCVTITDSSILSSFFSFSTFDTLNVLLIFNPFIVFNSKSFNILLIPYLTSSHHCNFCNQFHTN